MSPVIRVAFERHHRDDPNTIRLVDVKHRVGESRSQVAPHRRIKLSETQRLRTNPLRSALRFRHRTEFPALG